jgi:hypothetical protein
MWPHYCPCEKTVLWVGDREDCNWCGLKYEKSTMKPGETTSASAVHASQSTAARAPVRSALRAF